MRRVLMAIAMMGMAGAASAERLDHRYDLSVSGLRMASAHVVSDVTDTTYTATARMEARGIVGLFAAEDIDVTVRGTRTGPAGFAPQAFVQTSADDRLDIAWRGGAPSSIVTDPPRPADARKIPTLSRQQGTVDFLTAVLALTMPGTPEEICTRSFDSFTITRRVRIDGQGVGGTAAAPVCTVDYSKVDPETLAVRDPQTYRMELRPLPDGRHEVARITGPTEFGTATIARVN